MDQYSSYSLQFCARLMNYVQVTFYILIIFLMRTLHIDWYLTPSASKIYNYLLDENKISSIK